MRFLPRCCGRHSEGPVPAHSRQSSASRAPTDACPTLRWAGPAAQQVASPEKHLLQWNKQCIHYQDVFCGYTVCLIGGLKFTHENIWGGDNTTSPHQLKTPKSSHLGQFHNLVHYTVGKRRGQEREAVAEFAFRGSAIQRACKLLPKTALARWHFAAAPRKWACLTVFKLCFCISYLSEMND